MHLLMMSLQTGGIFMTVINDSDLACLLPTREHFISDILPIIQNQKHSDTYLKLQACRHAMSPLAAAV